MDLRGTGIQSLPDNLTVGGSLDLENCTGIQSLPDNLTVGGYLDLRGTGIQIADKNKVKTLKDGDYVPKRYLYADGILTHIKAHKTIQGYVFYQGKIKGKNVVSNGKVYAHCKTLREGIADIVFKEAADRGADQYKGLTLDSEIKTEEAITMYRIITGACRQGTQNFVDSLGELKDSYTVREIIDLTAGQFGADRFKDFFETEC